MSTVPAIQTDDYLARLQGIVSLAMRDKHIVIVGVGAGSYMCEMLARFAPGRITLCDFDVVETSNLSRTAYGVSDIGRLKVDALGDRIADASPMVQVDTLTADIASLSAVEEEKYIGTADLLIAGTDNFESQAYINELSIKYGIPGIWIGVHEMAKGGRVIWSLPGLTGCYRCVASERYVAFEGGGSEDVDLAGAVGSLADSVFIDMVALKVALAILERAENSSMGAFFEQMEERNDIVIRCDPSYAWGGMLWDAVLADLPAEPRPYADELRRDVLFAMDSMWLHSPADPDCPSCGRA